MTEKQKKIRGTIFALTGGALWGFSGTCGQYIFANSTMSSETVTSLRMLGSGLILLLFCLITRKGKTFAIWKEPKDAIRLLCFSLLGLLFCQYAYLSAIKHSNSGTATVLQYTGIVLLMIVTCLLEKRMPAKREGAAVLLAMGGVFLLATHGQPGDLVISSQGLFWGMIAAISLVTYNILPGDILKKWGTPVVNGFGMLIGGVVLAVVFRLWEENWNYDVYIFVALAAIILIGTLLAFCLYLQGVADLGPMKASLFGCAEPVMAAIISALWLHTTFTVVDLMGFVLIIGAVLLVSSREKESDGEQD